MLSHPFGSGYEIVEKVDEYLLVIYFQCTIPCLGPWIGGNIKSIKRGMLK